MNAYLLINCPIEDGGILEMCNVHICKSLHSSEQVSNLFTLTSWAAKGVLIRCRRYLLHKTKRTTNSDLSVGRYT